MKPNLIFTIANIPKSERIQTANQLQETLYDWNVLLRVKDGRKSSFMHSERLDWNDCQTAKPVLMVMGAYNARQAELLSECLQQILSLWHLVICYDKEHSTQIASSQLATGEEMREYNRAILWLKNNTLE